MKRISDSSGGLGLGQLDHDVDALAGGLARLKIGHVERDGGVRGVVNRADIAVGQPHVVARAGVLAEGSADPPCRAGEQDAGGGRMSCFHSVVIPQLQV